MDKFLDRGNTKGKGTNDADHQNEKSLSYEVDLTFSPLSQKISFLPVDISNSDQSEKSGSLVVDISSSDQSGKSGSLAGDISFSNQSEESRSSSELMPHNMTPKNNYHSNKLDNLPKEAIQSHSHNSSFSDIRRKYK